MSTSADLSAPLAELSILRNRVSEALLLYYEAPLGKPYEAYEMLKNSRREYAEKSIAFVEQMMDNSDTNSCVQEADVDINTRILLEKML